MIPPVALVSQLAVGFRRVLEYKAYCKDVCQADGVVLGLAQDRSPLLFLQRFNRAGFPGIVFVEALHRF